MKSVKEENKSFKPVPNINKDSDTLQEATSSGSGPANVGSLGRDFIIMEHKEISSDLNEDDGHVKGVEDEVRVIGSVSNSGGEKSSSDINRTMSANGHNIVKKVQLVTNKSDHLLNRLNSNGNLKEVSDIHKEVCVNQNEACIVESEVSFVDQESCADDCCEVGVDDSEVCVNQSDACLRRNIGRSTNQTDKTNCEVNLISGDSVSAKGKSAFAICRKSKSNDASLAFDADKASGRAGQTSALLAANLEPSSNAPCTKSACDEINCASCDISSVSADHASSLFDDVSRVLENTSPVLSDAASPVAGNCNPVSGDARLMPDAPRHLSGNACPTASSSVNVSPMSGGTSPPINQTNVEAFASIISHDIIMSYRRDQLDTKFDIYYNGRFHPSISTISSTDFPMPPAHIHSDTVSFYDAAATGVTRTLSGDDALDTFEVAKKVRDILNAHNVGQRLFAKYVLGLSQGTVSELLSKPKPWDKLTDKGRESYRKMHQWVSDDINIAGLKAIISPKKSCECMYHV